MILRRTAEVAFAIGVIALGGGLLFLAAGRFFEPLAIAPPAMVATAPAVALAPPAAPQVARPVAAPVVVARPVSPARHRAIVHPSRPRATPVAVAAPVIAAAPVPRAAPVLIAVPRIAHVEAPIPARVAKPVVKRVPKKSIARIARRRPSGRAPIVEVVVGQAAPPQLFAQIAFAPHQAGPPVAAHSLATLAIPFAQQPKARPASKPRHRFGVAYVHVAPKVERTPEPPIGYESRPVLLRADVPAATAVSPNAH